MTKVRVGDEDSFILDIDDSNEKYRFDFNSKWIENNNQTKKIVLRKIKLYKKSMVCIVTLRLADREYNLIHPHNTRRLYIHSSHVIHNNSIEDFLYYNVKNMNLRIQNKFPGEDIKLEYSYSNNEIKLYSNISYQIFKPVIIFRQGSLKLLGIFPGTKYYLNDYSFIEVNIHENNRHPNIITFSNIYYPKDRYLHCSFSNNPYCFVSKVNVDYHKLCKYFPMRDVDFDIWFTVDGKKIIFTPKIDIFYLNYLFANNILIWFIFGFY
jgi:hypothetical protein